MLPRLQSIKMGFVSLRQHGAETFQSKQGDVSAVSHISPFNSQRIPSAPRLLRPPSPTLRNGPNQSAECAGLAHMAEYQLRRVRECRWDLYPL